MYLTYTVEISGTEDDEVVMSYFSELMELFNHAGESISFWV